MSAAEAKQVSLTSSGLLDDYIPRKEFAAELGHREETLIRWEKDGKGPTPTRIGRAVFYFKPTVQQWLRAQEKAAGA